ncbi:MAG TPA: porin [Afifellaceae bacterium]|nr:porin [Afifellaceae bacterium]
MKLKSLLFGSAAALMAVTGAQAAEPLIEPIAEPVDYVRICDAFGTGFFFIPGTDTCLKIGGYVRADYVYDHDFEDVVVFQELFFEEDGRPIIRASPREDRNYNEFGTRARARLTFDSRVQTDIGMIRTYADLWITFGPLNGRGFNTVCGPSLGDNFPRQAFIQIANDWGTLTFGRADSFFEFWESDAFATRGIGEDAPISPRNLAAATFNLGGGVSATIALEDSATDGDGRLGDTPPTVFPVDLNLDGIPDALGLLPGGGVVAGVFPTGFAFTGSAGLHGGNRNPDVVANIRLD